MWEWTIDGSPGLLVAVPDGCLMEVLERVDQPPGRFRLDPYRDATFPPAEVTHLAQSVSRATVQREEEVMTNSLRSLGLATLTPWAERVVQTAQNRDPLLAALRELAALCDLAVREHLGICVYGD